MDDNSSGQISKPIDKRWGIRGIDFGEAADELGKITGKDPQKVTVLDLRKHIESKVKKKSKKIKP